MFTIHLADSPEAALPGLTFDTLADAAQETEFLLTETGKVHEVRATLDCAAGKAGEVVYTSKG